MTSLTLNSVFDRIAHDPWLRQNGRSVKKSAGRYSKRCLRTRQKLFRDRLLEQLEVFSEELNVAIMAELDERERINQELREQVHQELDIARGLIFYSGGSEAHKTLFTKFDNLVSDRSKRLKSDTLRKLLEHIKNLQVKAGINQDKPSEPPAVEPVTSTTSTPAPPQPSVSPVKIVSPEPSPPIASPSKPTAQVEPTRVVPEVSVPAPVLEPPKEKPAEEEIRPPREIISEQAKLRQKAQIPWRTPTRLEPYKIPRKSEPATRKNEAPKKTPVSSMVEPLPLKEPERLALRYKTKVRKRPAEEALPADSQFKKPFAEPQKPLFQRRHQLAPPAGPKAATNLPMPSRDPRNYGDYCNRRMTVMQNRARFERQNQQYFPPSRPQQHEQPGGNPATRPVAAAHPFAVPAPVPPTPPSTGPGQRPLAPKASVAPNVTRPAAAAAAVATPPPTPVQPVVRHETRKTNPVYSSDEPIRLGKKDDGKKQVSPTKPAEEVEPVKTVEKEPEVEKKSVEEKEKEKAPEVKQPTQKEKDNALQKNLLDMLQELGEGKAKMILDVIGKKSDDEAEKPKDETPQEEEQTKRTTSKKAGKKFKRIRAKQDESSSEEEGQKKEQSKKEKSKPAKRVSGGSREVSALIENSSDWMAKGSSESHYTRRRGTAAQLLISPQRKEEGDGTKKDSSDEDGLVVSSKQPVEDDSLLTVAKVVPVAAPAKGKQKAKEPTFVYNDKKTVHCNSNFSSNCALCSFNGSAIVDHYVYDHKTYEVFVSRVSPKMADIIRSDLFMTNGTLLTDDNQLEKIRFKCYFCLAPKELERAEWTDHLSSHTGEYRYRCTSCPVMSRTEELGSKFFHEKSCLKPSLAIYNNIEFEDNHLYGFICDACNYIQIRRVNMERHLKREHPSSDVTCSRFSILNYKIETKPIVDEELLMMADLEPSTSLPTVMIPFTAKSEPLDAYEIVNQPVTEDEEMPEQLPRRRTSIRLESIHIGQVGQTNLPNQLAQLPFAIKAEPGQQDDVDEAITSSNSYESPMSPEPPSSSEAQPAIPILQIQCVSGGVDLGAFTVKQEKPDEDGDSDGSDATVDLNVSSGGEGRQCATDTNQNQGNSGGASSTTSTTSSSAGGSGASPVAGGSSNGGAAGAGGDDGNDRKKEEFPVPLMIKVEKDEKDEEEEKKKALQGVTSAMENVRVKTEKPDQDSLPEEEYDFVELILDSKRMQNVAFVERDSEALFLCVSQVCKFVTKDADALSKHIARNHRRAEWDGYCQICRSQITPTDCAITDEYQHLLTIHARKKTPPLEVPASVPAVPNVIRIRRMPGDTLSMGDSSPPPLAPIQPVVQAFAPPMIIQSAATISQIAAPAAAPVPIAINQLFTTPTHTIPAQIRPVGPNITVTPLAPSSVNPAGGPISMRTVRLKPWTNMVTTKGQEHCREMLEEISLLCLFKCMSRACAFTTNHRMFMAKHLANHDAMYRVGPNSTGRKCWLECAYCDLIAPNSGDLLIHIDAEHSNCGFQCNLCFYRSRDPTNVVVHQKDHHTSADTPKKILIMPDNLRSFGDEEWRAMQESLRQHVLPLHCTICKESFYILSAYMTHLTGHSQCNISCQVCSATIDKRQMARHLLQHSIGLYECVYCLFGANTKSTMALHVSNAHSSKPLYCCVRYNKQRSDGVEYPPNKIESMELKTMSCTVSPDLFKRCNYSQAELNFKPPDLEINRTMAYRKGGGSALVASSEGGAATTTGANIQIQITDEAGRPLIISIPVQNAPKPAAVPFVAIPGPSTAPTPVPVAIQPANMPMISTVQGGVRINPSPPLVQPQKSAPPLPVIASVQGSLPPLRAIKPKLPVIASVQSIAPRSASPVVTSSTSGSTYAIPATISAVAAASTTSTTSTKSSDMYTTTVAEADTQSSSVELVSGGGESDSSGSKCSTPVQPQSPAAAAPTTKAAAKSMASKKFASTTQIRIDFLFNGSIEKFDRLEKRVSEMIKHTGFCGQELNACGVEKCNSRYSDPVKLNLHLLKHHSVSSYKCYHCEDKFKTAHELITHIKTHGRHRYLCFLCDAKSHFLKMMIVHVQQDHNSADVILTYLHPKKRDIHNDLVVICPQNVTQIQLQNYINNILQEEEEPPQAPKKKKFAPSEIDQLPEREIFAEDLLCANCDYATKIRKNLKRHLERHLDPPATAPLPVIVDVTSKPPPAAIVEVQPTTSTAKPTVPQQIDPDKLYQCAFCKLDCPPVISEFRTHLYRIHRTEKVYKCIHCQTIVNSGFLCIDKIVNHLKLHREKLYKCSECDYYRDEKHLISPHIKQHHADVPLASVVTIREKVAVAVTAADDFKWQCDLCETIRETRAEMVEHMTGDHKLSDKQYKCSYCSYKSSDNDSFKVHFAENHPKVDILIISLFHALPSERKEASAVTAVVATPSDDLDSTQSGSKKFSCGSEGCSYSSMNLQIVKKHFQSQHPEQSLVVFDDTAIDPDKRERFDYFVKYGCGYCADKFNGMDDVIEHWYNLHMGTGDSEKPLMFKLFKLVRCFYCDKLSTYDEIKEHSATDHPGQLFACIDHQNVFKCGECPHIHETLDSADLLKHFKIYHSASKVEDPCDYIEDEFLHRMLEQNNNRYTCNHCQLTHDSRFEYECHIAVCEFAGLPSSFKTTPKSVEIQYICSGCDQTFGSEFAIANHIRTHLTLYSCSFCKREFKELSSLDQHQIEFHNATPSAQLTLKDLNQHRLFFTKIRMLFPNGLLLSKLDAHRTVCGSVEDIMNHVRAINDQELNHLKTKKYLQLPLHLDDQPLAQTCEQFLSSQPSQMTLTLENLIPEHIAEIQDQVLALFKLQTANNANANAVKRKRGRPAKRKSAARVVYSESAEEAEDLDDDEWTPQHKRIGWSRPGSSRPTPAPVTVKKEYEELSTTTGTTTGSGRVSSRSRSSSSDDELLINLKKEKPEEIAVKVEPPDMVVVPVGKVEMESVAEAGTGTEAVTEMVAKTVEEMVTEVETEKVTETATETITGMPMDEECDEEAFQGF